MTWAYAGRSIAATIVTCVAVLTGCGGGGGGGTGAGVPTTLITAANSTTVAAEGFKGSDALTNTAGNSSSSVVGVVTTSTGSTFSLADFASGQLETLATRQFNSPVMAAVIISSASCTGGGTVSVTLDDLDNNNRLSSGDTATFIFANCVESGVTINGSFSINDVIVTGIPDVTPARSVGATFTLNNLSAQRGASISTVNGDFSLQTATADGVAFDTTITGNKLSVAENGQTRTLSDFSESLSVNRSTGVFSVDVDATLTSTKLGGTTLSFQTLEPFTGILGAFPSSGVLEVDGADDSNLTLTALSSTSVQIDVDADGDGVFETFTTNTWSEIIAA